MASARPPSHRRGVSLVEALVALAVMAFGMLALVGVQATMRLNSDVAKQRSEATRIATEEIERLRGFRAMAVVTGQPGVSYDEIISRTSTYVAPDATIGNTTYNITRKVIDAIGTQQKTITVVVDWTDRSGDAQSVALETVISGAHPALSALLAVPPVPSAVHQRGGRHPSIPVGAEYFDPESSGLVPPGSTGVLWVFNNLTGVMKVCNSSGANCVAATLVSGTVQFHLPSVETPPTANSEAPPGPALNLAAWPDALAMSPKTGAVGIARCYAQAAVPGQSYINYECAVEAQQLTGWGGKLDLRVLDGSGNLATFGNVASTLKTCRYTSDVPSVDVLGTAGIDESLSDPHGEFTANSDHPKTYCMELPGSPPSGEVCTGRRVTRNLINQNFLVIRGDMTCPPDDVSTPLINGNTRPHQP